MRYNYTFARLYRLTVDRNIFAGREEAGSGPALGGFTRLISNIARTVFNALPLAVNCWTRCGGAFHLNDPAKRSFVM